MGGKGGRHPIPPRERKQSGQTAALSPILPTAGPGRAGLIAPPSLDSGDDKVLLGLLPRQHHPFARTRKVGHFPQACRPPAEFRAQHRHPYRGRAQSGVVKIKGLIFPWEKNRIGATKSDLRSSPQSAKTVRIWHRNAADGQNRTRSRRKGPGAKRQRTQRRWRPG